MDQTIDDTQKKIIILDATRREIIRGLSVLLLILSVFLFLRFLFEVFGANPQAFFVAFVYLVSDIFLLPFWGIFPNSHTAPLVGQPVFDGTTLIALFCYLLFIPFVMVITFIVIKMLKTQTKVKETVKQRKPVGENKEIVKQVAT